MVKRRKRICTMYKYRPEDIYEEIITGIKQKRPKEEYYKSLLDEQSRSMNQSYLNESGTSFNRSKKRFNSTHKREESHLESPRSIGKRKSRIKKLENTQEERKDLLDDKHEPKTQSDHNHHNGGEAQTSSKENKQRRGFKANANHEGENTEDRKSQNISKGFSTSGRKVGKEKTSLNDEHPSNNVTHEDGSTPIVKRRKRACTMYKYRPEDIFAEIISGLENRKTRSIKRENRNEEKEELPVDEQVPRTQSAGEHHTSNGGGAQASSKENKKRRGVKADASRKEENTQETESEGQPAEPNERKRRRAVKKVEYKEPSLNVKLRRE
ncbi:uncharacterized protein LOC123317224 isoform X2 [Coccinella septempunctata]|uniref:uncharacterized protein LOC123317224 isoform X2 n=1 Tax=Coccinella septempunctata TaxID=41139 RepID=UPI001D082313|nr:uncharacterized protein LOC123317224 isoform X2 [Coccinella septempunctata]